MAGLTGRDFDSVIENPQSGGTPSGDGQAPDAQGVITLTDSLRDAVAVASDQQLAEVVRPWSQTEELQQPGWEDVTEAEHLEFLRDLQALALSAKDAGDGLYCYYCL